MALNPNPNYPLAHSYVLKLHRDAAQRGEIVGRLENMASGACCDFVTGEQLLACLAGDCQPPASPDADSSPSAGSPSPDSGQTTLLQVSAVTDPSHAPGTSPSSRTRAFPSNRLFIRTTHTHLLPRRFSPAWLLTMLALVSSVGLLAGRPSFSAQSLATFCPAALGSQMSSHHPHLAAQIGRGLDIPQENSK